MIPSETSRMNPGARVRATAGRRPPGSVGASARGALLLSVLTGLLAGSTIFPPVGLAEVFGAPVGALPANTSATCASFGNATCTLIGIRGGSGRSAWTDEVPYGHYVITQAEVRTGARVGPMALTVIEEAFGPFGFYEAVKERSKTFTPRKANAVNRVTGLDLPVFSGFEQGGTVSVTQDVAITLLNDTTPLPVNIGGEFASCQVVAPAQPVGGSVLPAACGLSSDWTPLLAATLATFTIQPNVQLQNGGTRARLGLDLLDPGKLRIGAGARTAVVAAAAAAAAAAAPVAAASRAHGRRRRHRVLAPFTHTYRKAGRVHPVIRLTKWGRALLHRRHRLRVRVKITLTPTGAHAPSRRSVQKLITFRARRHGH